MVDGLNEYKYVSTENKGVNTTSDTFPLPDIASEAPNNNDFPSLHNVRNQLQNVIDVMGTTTPHLIYSSSMGADADNEDSVISSTSIFSSVLQVKHVNKNRDHCQSISTCNSPRDISEMSNVQESETYAMMVNELPHEKPTQQPLYVPAVLPPAVLCMNPSCVCTHSFGYTQQIPVTANQDENRQMCKSKVKTEKKHRLSALIGKLTKANKEHEPAALELYKMNIMQAKDNGSPPQRFVFDLVDEIPKPEVNTVGTNTKNCSNTTGNNKNICSNEQIRKVASKKSNHTYKGITHNSHYSGMVVAHNISDESCKHQHAAYYKNLEEKSKLQYTSQKDTARVDVYYFDHGNAAYYRTTDCPPLILTEILAEKAESYATKFWAELFGTIYIGFAFFTSFILQFFRFLLHSIIRPLTIGLLQLISDYFFKPFLAALFNAIIQPPLIFLYNIATSLRDLCDPLAEGLGYFFREIAVICKSIRLFEIKQDRHTTVEKSCKNPT